MLVIICINNIEIVVFLVVIEDTFCIRCNICYACYLFDFFPFIRFLFSETTLDVFASVFSHLPVTQPLFTLIVPAFVEAVSVLFAYVTPGLSWVMAFVY